MSDNHRELLRPSCEVISLDEARKRRKPPEKPTESELLIRALEIAYGGDEA